MRKWKVLGERTKGKGERIEEIINILLENRGLKTKKEREEFLNPPKPHTIDPIRLGIKKDQLLRAIRRIKEAIDGHEQIVVFGDYDVDGICGSAILWETLHGLGAKVLPYIPHRVEEGYGLSIRGIENLKSSSFAKASKDKQISNIKLIITVDNGIVANEAVEFANKNDIDVIITDHHVPSKKLPKAYAIVHTTKLCGAGVAFLLAQEISNIKYQISNKSQNPNSKYQIQESHLELVALATIADLVPLIGPNRTLTKSGLEKLRKTDRVGLRELFKEATLNPSIIDVYEVGHIIAPRLNAMGRIEHAMDSLRLLCTKDSARAKVLAQKLGKTNRERQRVTEETAMHASARIRNSKHERRNLLFIAHESYQQGVIGLVAGKLVDEFYRPAIVVSIGEVYSKASARSVAGFNIIEFIRSAGKLLIDAGGHPMAAGFTVETTKLVLLQKMLEGKAKSLLGENLLTQTLRIDCELTLPLITEELYDEIQKFTPFGMANPQPLFVTRNVIIEDMWLVGNDGKHLKLKIKDQKSNIKFDAIAFGMGERAGELHVGDRVDIVYIIEEDKWNRNKLQLKVKDI